MLMSIACHIVLSDNGMIFSMIDVNEVVQLHSTVILNLLGAHTLSGCNTVSLLAGIGKATIHRLSLPW